MLLDPQSLFYAIGDVFETNDWLKDEQYGFTTEQKIKLYQTILPVVGQEIARFVNISMRKHKEFFSNGALVQIAITTVSELIQSDPRFVKGSAKVKRLTALAYDVIGRTGAKFMVKRMMNDNPGLKMFDDEISCRSYDELELTPEEEMAAMIALKERLRTMPWDNECNEVRVRSGDYYEDEDSVTDSDDDDDDMCDDEPETVIEIADKLENYQYRENYI